MNILLKLITLILTVIIEVKSDSERLILKVSKHQPCNVPGKKNGHTVDL